MKHEKSIALQQADFLFFLRSAYAKVNVFGYSLLVSATLTNLLHHTFKLSFTQDYIRSISNHWLLITVTNALSNGSICFALFCIHQPFVFHAFILELVGNISQSPMALFGLSCKPLNVFRFFNIFLYYFNITRVLCSPTDSLIFSLSRANNFLSRPAKTKQTRKH